MDERERGERERERMRAREEGNLKIRIGEWRGNEKIEGMSCVARTDGRLLNVGNRFSLFLHLSSRIFMKEKIFRIVFLSPSPPLF